MSRAGTFLAAIGSFFATIGFIAAIIPFTFIGGGGLGAAIAAAAFVLIAIGATLIAFIFLALAVAVTRDRYAPTAGAMMIYSGTLGAIGSLLWLLFFLASANPDLLYRWITQPPYPIPALLLLLLISIAFIKAGKARR